MPRTRGLRGRIPAGCDHRVDDAGHWLLTADERGNPASGLPAFTSGNRAEALVDGAAYFDRLVTAVERMTTDDILMFTDWRCDPD